MTTEIFDLNINYSERGEGDIVLILHGWGSNITLHEAMANVLATKYKVVMPDLPGFGQSEEPSEPWDVDRYVDFVEEFLKLYNPKKITLIGHSFGGRVIIKLCSRKEPFDISKIVLIDSAGVMPEKTAKQKAKQKMFKTGKKLLSTKAGQLFFPDALDELRERTGSADYNAASPIMRSTLVKVVNEDLCHLMPNVKAETLLVWGENDDATPLSDAKKMESLMPNAGLVSFPGCGHYSFLENAGQFHRVLASFLL